MESSLAGGAWARQPDANSHNLKGTTYAAESKPFWRDDLKAREMNIMKCPHFRAKLGNFLYADACPHCHEELKNNTRPLLSTPKQDSRIATVWPVRMFTKLLRFVES